eukprot:11140885-Alexandrium_andersonii.AAC.1
MSDRHGWRVAEERAAKAVGKTNAPPSQVLPGFGRTANKPARSTTPGSANDRGRRNQETDTIRLVCHVA